MNYNFQTVSIQTFQYDYEVWCRRSKKWKWNDLWKWTVKRKAPSTLINDRQFKLGAESLCWTFKAVTLSKIDKKHNTKSWGIYENVNFNFESLPCTATVTAITSTIILVFYPEFHLWSIMTDEKIDKLDSLNLSQIPELQPAGSQSIIRSDSVEKIWTWPERLAFTCFEK